MITGAFVGSLFAVVGLIGYAVVKDEQKKTGWFRSFLVGAVTTIISLLWYIVFLLEASK